LDVGGRLIYCRFENVFITALMPVLAYLAPTWYMPRKNIVTTVFFEEDGQAYFFRFIVSIARNGLSAKVPLP
jgi:hypothetical protein